MNGLNIALDGSDGPTYGAGERKVCLEGLLESVDGSVEGHETHESHCVLEAHRWSTAGDRPMTNRSSCTAIVPRR